MQGSEACFLSTLANDQESSRESTFSAVCFVESQNQLQHEGMRLNLSAYWVWELLETPGPSPNLSSWPADNSVSGSFVAWSVVGSTLATHGLQPTKRAHLSMTFPRQGILQWLLFPLQGSSSTQSKPIES